MAFAQVNETLGFLTPFGPRRINAVQLDIVVDEETVHTATVTQHPVEVPTRSAVRNGAISDHAYLEPDIHIMRGVVSDFPISWRRIGEIFTDPYASATADTRSLSAYQLLLKHFRELEPFDLVTPLGTLENMVFISFRIPRRAQNKHAIEFVARFQEVLIVVPEVISASRTPDQVRGEQAETGAISDSPRGQVTGAEVPKPSFAHTIISGAASGGGK